MPDVDMTVIAEVGIHLGGTLVLPEGPGPHPAVLLLHGSGPLDRDSNTRKARMDLGPALATALAERGIASLRYDRRGVPSGDWRASGFVDNRRDAVAALHALADRPDIRAEAVGVVGHSEGAVHAMALGTRPDVAAVVLLAGYARSGEAAMLRQAAMITEGLPRPLRTPLRAVVARLLGRVRKTRTDVARVLGMPVNARWMREMLDHDSRQDLARIRGSVLAVTGDKDVQVDAADLDVVRDLVPGEVEVHRVPDLTHLLRRDPGRPSPRSYPAQLRRPVDPDLLALVAGWLTTRLR
ncbi:alpha/beta hydrolase [Umezawaea sp. NPDC059074]|uniref:alpha/beta hydrolase n=1 Tax=Umezawaea sp. NPDC059074 TaxID=3346716 RepID=UPI00369E6F76